MNEHIKLEEQERQENELINSWITCIAFGLIVLGIIAFIGLTVYGIIKGYL